MTEKLDQWSLPGINGSSILERKFKILNPIDVKKKQEDEQKAKELLLKSEMEKGFSSGLIQGKDEAFKLESVKLKERYALLNDLFMNLEKDINNFKSLLNDEFVNQIEQVVTSLVKSIVKVELATNKEIIRQNIKEAIDYLPLNIEEVNIYLNAEDLKIVQDEKDFVDSSKTNLKLQAKDDLQRGSCQVVANSSHIDINIGNRLVESLTKVKDAINN